MPWTVRIWFPEIVSEESKKFPTVDGRARCIVASIVIDWRSPYLGLFPQRFLSSGVQCLGSGFTPSRPRSRPPSYHDTRLDRA